MQKAVELLLTHPEEPLARMAHHLPGILEAAAAAAFGQLPRLWCKEKKGNGKGAAGSSAGGGGGCTACLWRASRARLDESARTLTACCKCRGVMRCAVLC